MKPGKRAPRSSLGLLLFMIWFVAAGCVITGVALPVATLVAYLLTLLLLQLWYNQNERRDRDRSRSKRAGTARDPWTWSGSVLPKIRAVRRRTRRAPHARPRLSLGTAMRVTPIPKPPLDSFKDEPRQPCSSEDDRWSGLLTLLALVSVLFTGAALVVESMRLAESIGHLYLFTIVVPCGVVLLPLMIGLYCRSAIHSILTMISLSAALQAILFRPADSLPEGFFLTLAALALAGVPLGLVRFWGSLDRRLERGCLQTTTGRLLRGKWQRMRRGKHLICESRRPS
jgi:hypothetical protein